MSLEQTRIVSIAQNVPGPLAVARLHSAGASVVKVEPTNGDPFLTLSPEWHAEMHEGITIERLDLKSDSGRARIFELAREADLFVTSQRPSALMRLGIDDTSLAATSPRLRFLHIVGSIRDPEQPGHDLTYQAQAGLVADEMPRTLLADVMTSERAFAAALQLLERPAGSSRYVGLVESLDSLVAPIRHGLTTPTGQLGGAAPRYRLYPTRAGLIAVAALEPHFENRLYAELGAEHGADLSAHFLERTAAEWEIWARDHDVPIVAVKS